VLGGSKGVILRSEATKNLVYGGQGARHSKNETLRLRLRVTIVSGHLINTERGDYPTYGNTEKVAQAIGGAIGGRVLRVDEVNHADLTGFDLLIVGSPTHGGWPTEGIHGLLKASLALEGVNIRTASIWNRLFRFGYAAPRIARGPERNDGNLLAPPEGFVVLGTQGPPKDGELERAAGWAKGIAG
jgi:flavodoxin